MAIEITWLNDEKTIMLHRYIGSWTMTEIMADLDKIYEMIDSVDHQVDIIADVEQAGYPPTGMMTRGLRYYRTKRHPRQGIQVIVGKTFLLTFMRGLTSVASAIIPQARQVRFMDTIDEALEYIHAHRATRTG